MAIVALVIVNLDLESLPGSEVLTNKGLGLTAVKTEVI
jgi:hypothetical protein